MALPTNSTDFHLTKPACAITARRALCRTPGARDGRSGVAEGVEEEGPRRLLAEWGCDHGQGWLWAKAMPEHDLMSWFARVRVRTAAAG